MSESSESMTSTSRDSKKPPEAPDSTGTPAAASSRLQTRPDTFALRRSMAISPQRSGLSPPGAVSIVPDSTSSLIRLRGPAGLYGELVRPLALPLRAGQLYYAQLGPRDLARIRQGGGEAGRSHRSRARRARGS